MKIPEIPTNPKKIHVKKESNLWWNWCPRPGQWWGWETSSDCFDNVKLCVKDCCK